MPKPKGFKQKVPPHIMQRAFCENIAAGQSQAAAARVAGYSSPSKAADTLLKRADIKETIEQMREDTRKSGLITREKSIEGLLDAIDQARIIDDPSAMIRGWQELNRMHGFHAPTKVEVDLPEGTKQMLNVLASVPKEQLLELIGEEEETILEAEEVEDGSFQVPAYAVG